MPRAWSPPAPGRPGRDGADGINGLDGKDGVSVVNVYMDFDNSLVIELSDGRQINAGEILPPDLSDRLKVIINQGASGGGGGFFGSILSSFFGGFFANGGTLGANKFGIAGERGPELITGPATVTPLDQLSMAGVTNVTYNIQAVDASSFRTLVARDPEFIFKLDG